MRPVRRRPHRLITMGKERRSADSRAAESWDPGASARIRRITSGSRISAPMSRSRPSTACPDSAVPASTIALPVPGSAIRFPLTRAIHCRPAAPGCASTTATCSMNPCAPVLQAADARDGGAYRHGRERLDNQQLEAQRPERRCGKPRGRWHRHLCGAGGPRQADVHGTAESALSQAAAGRAGCRRRGSVDIANPGIMHLSH